MRSNDLQPRNGVIRLSGKNHHQQRISFVSLVDAPSVGLQTSISHWILLCGGVELNPVDVCKNTWTGYLFSFMGADLGGHSEL